MRAHTRVHHHRPSWLAAAIARANACEGVCPDIRIGNDEVGTVASRLGDADAVLGEDLANTSGLSLDEAVVVL